MSPPRRELVGAEQVQLREALQKIVDAGEVATGPVAGSILLRLVRIRNQFVDDATRGLLNEIVGHLKRSVGIERLLMAIGHLERFLVAAGANERLLEAPTSAPAESVDELFAQLDAEKITEQLEDAAADLAHGDAGAKVVELFPGAARGPARSELHDAAREMLESVRGIAADLTSREAWQRLGAAEERLAGVLE